MFEIIEYYQRLSQLLQTDQPIWQATVTKTSGSTPSRLGMKLVIPLVDEVFGNLGGGELEHTVINTIRHEQPEINVIWSFVLNDNQPPYRDNTVQKQTSMLCGGYVEVLIEPLSSPFPLYIIGAGHCGKALAEFAIKTGFSVTLIDNRHNVLMPEHFPSNVRLVYNDYQSLDKAIVFTNKTFIVIMTHGHAHDREILEFCLKKPFRYLGMIGSNKKVKETFALLREKGFSDEDFLRVHAPIGLSIGSHTPYEIAVSILAELILVRNAN